MANFHIEVTAHAPAPRRFQYRMEGSNMGVAVGKAMRQMRKDLPRKRIYLLTVKALPIEAMGTGDKKDE